MTPRSPRLFAAALLIICVVWPLSAHVEAKGRKGKSVSAKKSGSRKQARSSRGRSSRRSRARSARARRANYPRPAAYDDYLTSQTSEYDVVPDRIEVIEHGTPPVELARYLNPPLPRNTTATSNIEPDPGSSARRRNVNIESARVMQIQQALTNQGFYGGEISGNYDAETVEAMRRFQISERIAATGYPTAHALKRLGLTNW